MLNMFGIFARPAKTLLRATTLFSLFVCANPSSTGGGGSDVVQESPWTLIPLIFVIVGSLVGIAVTCCAENPGLPAPPAPVEEKKPETKQLQIQVEKVEPVSIQQPEFRSVDSHIYVKLG
jgi:hypothetical protein